MRENTNPIRKYSPIAPRNLLPILNEGLMGYRGKIEKIDLVHMIDPLEMTVAAVKEKVDLEQSDVNPVVDSELIMTERDKAGAIAVGELQHHKGKTNMLLESQTFLFKASEEVTIHITPLIKKKVGRGPGPEWHQMPLAMGPRGKPKPLNLCRQSPASISCPSSYASSYDPSDYRRNRKRRTKKN